MQNVESGWFWGRGSVGYPRSLAMSPFDTAHTTSLSPTLGVNLFEFRQDLWHKKLESMCYHVPLFVWSCLHISDGPTNDHS